MHRETTDAGRLEELLVGGVGGVEVEALTLGRRLVIRAIRVIEVEVTVRLSVHQIFEDGRHSIAGREFDGDRLDGALDVGTSEVGDEVADSI